MTNIVNMPEAKPPENGKNEREQTAGEVIFDRTVYTGIGFGVNEASSLWITDQFLHGKPTFLGKWLSKEGFDAASKWVARAFDMKDKVTHGKPTSGKDRAGNALLMITLLSGGTLLLWPMKWLEDHKAQWVKRANHLADRFRDHNMNEREIASRDAEVEQSIACAPKQTWPSLLMGRVIACTSSVLTGTFLVGHNHNRKLMDASEKLFTGSVQPESRKNAAHRYAALTGVETYSCAVSSLVLEIMSKLFARGGKTLHDPKLCRIAAADEPQGNEAPEDKPSCRTSHCQKVMSDKMLSESGTGLSIG